MLRKIMMMGAATLTLSACATPTTNAPQITTLASKSEADRQVEYMFANRWSETKRLADTADKLLQANQDLCPAKRARLGILASTAADFKPPLQDAATKALGLTETVKITHLTPSGAAMAAGLHEGDQIVSLNGISASSGPKATTQLMAALTAALEKDPSKVTLRVKRGEEILDVSIKPRMACAYDVELMESNDINAYADGRKIYVTRGIMRLAGSDQELALVIAHELAHNARGHIAAQRQNAGVAMAGGALLDILAAAGGVNTQGAFTKAAGQAGAGYKSTEFEAEADYVGMYFLARSGFDTSGAENFWRKMAVEYPDSIFIKTGHPTTPDRYLAISAANSEIATKRSGGAQLLPNEKSK